MSGTTTPTASFHTVPLTVEYNQLTHKFVAKCPPGDIPISVPTVINFQLVDAPPEMKFVGISSKPVDTDQLSGPAISTDGKMLTIIDVATTPLEVNVTLDVTVSDVKHSFPIDPQIRNQPR